MSKNKIQEDTRIVEANYILEYQKPNEVNEEFIKELKEYLNKKKIVYRTHLIQISIIDKNQEKIIDNGPALYMKPTNKYKRKYLDEIQKIASKYYKQPMTYFIQGYEGCVDIENYEEVGIPVINI